MVRVKRNESLKDSVRRGETIPNSYHVCQISVLILFIFNCFIILFSVTNESYAFIAIYKGIKYYDRVHYVHL